MGDRRSRSLRAVGLVSLLALATSCGSRVSDEQAVSEAREEVEWVGVAAGSGLGVSADAAGERVARRGTSGRDVDDAASSSPVQVSEPDPGPGTPATEASEGDRPGAQQPRPKGEECREGARDVGLTESEIRIGNVSTLSGPVPALFKGALVGTQAYAAYLNSRGGLWCREVVVVPGDDRLDSGENRAEHLELRDEVFAFVGSFSTNDDGGAEVLRDCRCPDIGGSLSSARFELPNHYSPQPLPPGWQSGPARWYAQRYGTEVITRWALFVSAIQSAREIAANLRAVYESEGFEVVYSREVQPNETNFTGDVIQMRNRGVRALSWQGAAADMGRLAAEMRQQNFSVDLPNWGNDAYSEVFLQEAGEEAAEGMIVDQLYALFRGEDAGRVPEIETFNEWMQRMDPSQTVDLFALYGWLSAKLFAEALRDAEELSREGLLEALSAKGVWDADGMIAPVHVADKEPSDCFFVFTFRDGEFVRLFPDPASGELYACDVAPYVHASELE